MTCNRTGELWRFVFESLPENFLRDVDDAGVDRRVRIFPWSLVVWLMLCQRLDSNHTLSKAVDAVRYGECEAILSHLGVSLSARRRDISSATGGYSQARSRLPLVVIEKIADALNARIQEMHRNATWEGHKVYLVDGTMLTLPHSKELMAKYPACNNQHGESHCPR